MKDFDFPLISKTFSDYGVSLDDLAAVAVAVFDHGNAPAGVSDRQGIDGLGVHDGLLGQGRFILRRAPMTRLCLRKSGGVPEYIGTIAVPNLP